MWRAYGEGDIDLFEEDGTAARFDTSRQRDAPPNPVATPPPHAVRILPLPFGLEARQENSVYNILWNPTDRVYNYLSGLDISLDRPFLLNVLGWKGCKRRAYPDNSIGKFHMKTIQAVKEASSGRENV
ncbi:hypothetical protein ARMGADRAFT_1034081 [Armillaria gallica]|uniref:Uncharacterized protein n=1 Tax=Armillaria gallica TaxID=47427 RepID=A0A2H3DC14_ARMGA|nr:hypothetical protein ARMGADRAFT_1034081 [Armillaria gallica]